MKLFKERKTITGRLAPRGVDWEVLHGDPADAICRYVQGMPDTLLARTMHARRAVERAVLGSVASYYVRHAGVPMLLYWPQQHGLLNKIGSRALSSTIS